MGWSFGGVVTTLAASRGDRYAAAIVQAPGSLNWNRSPELRQALVEAAGKIRVPLECAVAENDATTESAKAVCAAASKAGARTVVKIYPPFTSGRERPGNPPGHAIFSAFGVDRWRDDVLAFIADALRGR
jgi:dienelactone hydrolase